MSRRDGIVPTAAMTEQPQRGPITQAPNYCSAQTRDYKTWASDTMPAVGDEQGIKTDMASAFKESMCSWGRKVKRKYDHVLCNELSQQKMACVTGVRVTLQQRFCLPRTSWLM